MLLFPLFPNHYLEIEKSFNTKSIKLKKQTLLFVYIYTLKKKIIQEPVQRLLYQEFFK
jgi:hypothetical protein